MQQLLEDIIIIHQIINSLLEDKDSTIEKKSIYIYFSKAVFTHNENKTHLHNTSLSDAKCIIITNDNEVQLTNSERFL